MLRLDDEQEPENRSDSAENDLGSRIMGKRGRWAMDSRGKKNYFV